MEKKKTSAFLGKDHQGNDNTLIFQKAIENMNLETGFLDKSNYYNKKSSNKLNIRLLYPNKIVYPKSKIQKKKFRNKNIAVRF